MTTTAAKQIASTQTSSPREQPRATLAMASDPGKALRLSPTFEPDIDLLTTEGVIAFGVKGSGKSNLLALLVEQVGRFFLPQIILDTEREYHNLAPLLPHGVLANARRCPSGADILHKGLQVVLDLQSWETDEAAAHAICRLVGELFTATNALAPQERVPCIIHLDEAGYWLPQEAVTYLSKETRKALTDAFHKLASRGRKQGLTPFLYTQSISEVAKSAIRQAGVKVLMRQTLDIDLSRYCQYIQGATTRTKKAIQAYPSGKAIVILPDGSQHRVQFHERQSEHVSHTPQAQAALVKFAAMDIDVAALPMRDLTADVPPEQAQGRLHQDAQPAKGRLSPTPTTMTEQVYALLAENPTLPLAELMRTTGCSDTTASKARRTYFELHPEQQAVPQKTVTERIHELLAANPALQPAELMKLVGCSDTTAFKARKAYFEQHPEQQQAASTPPTMTERLYALLAENPTLRPAELRKLVGCDHTLATKVRRAYFEQHPELQAVPQKTMTEQIYDLLAANPALPPAELRKLVGCDQTLASRVHKAYFELHPEQVVPQKTMTERLYALLTENPTLRPAELVNLTGCSDTSASRVRRMYFEQHSEQQSPEQGKPKGTQKEKGKEL